MIEFYSINKMLKMALKKHQELIKDKIDYFHKMMKE